jgi:hypothetical membrane protein
MRWGVIGGIGGPVAFVSAWAVGGALTRNYSPVDDAISRLAAIGAPTRPLMTAGFVAFSAGLALNSRLLRRHNPGPSWLAADLAALGSLGVAAVALDGGHDGLHGAFAGATYVALVAVPAAAARSFLRRGQRRAAIGSGVIAAGAAASLLASGTTTSANGLFQRIGLTLIDVWLVTNALAATEIA